MNKGYFTTFQAAKLMSVTPDAVLKWIKSGKLAAYRTPGGHYRIKKSNIKVILRQNGLSSPSKSENRRKSFQYCWEFNAQQNNCTIKCEDCVVYKARAKRCYEMSNFPSEFGFLKLFCKSSCDKCDYYKFVETDI